VLYREKLVKGSSVLEQNYVYNISNDQMCENCKGLKILEGRTRQIKFLFSLSCIRKKRMPFKYISSGTDVQTNDTLLSKEEHSCIARLLSHCFSNIKGLLITDIKGVCFVLIPPCITDMYKSRDILMIFTKLIYTGAMGVIFKKSSSMPNKFCFDNFTPR